MRTLAIFPKLIRPRVKAQFNHWFHPKSTVKSRTRDLAIGFMSLIIIVLTFLATKDSLATLKTQSTTQISLQNVMQIFLFLIFSMLLFSNIIVALTSLFLSRELPQLISAPLTPLQFFNGKLLHIISSSSWIALVFSLPLLMAIGTTSEASLAYYLTCLFILPPFFIIPAGIATSLAIIGARLFSVQKLRFMALIAGLGLILILYGSSSLITDQKDLLKDRELLVTFLDKSNLTYGPARWCAELLYQSLSGLSNLDLLLLVKIYSLTLIIYLVNKQIFKRIYYQAFDKSISAQDRYFVTSYRAQKIVTSLTPFMNQQTRAFLIKEIKTFCRDIAQSLQLIILLGLCLMYLSNLKKVDISTINESQYIWAKSLLILVHTGLTGFILCAICTRFVYTSVSLEGQAYWLICKAPISIKNYLRIKFYIWWIPIAIISTTVYVSGALALFSEPTIIFAQFLFGLSLSYGLVGLAMGFGTFFVTFDWDHVAQLSTNVGSVLYMLCSCLLLFITLLPSTILLVMYTLKSHFNLPFSDIQWNTFCSLTAILIAYLHYMTTRWCLTRGARALERMNN
jgi:ABC-2 type transport system permease protein